MNEFLEVTASRGRAEPTSSLAEHVLKLRLGAANSTLGVAPSTGLEPDPARSRRPTRILERRGARDADGLCVWRVVVGGILCPRSRPDQSQARERAKRRCGPGGGENGRTTRDAQVGRSVHTRRPKTQRDRGALAQASRGYRNSAQNPRNCRGAGEDRPPAAKVAAKAFGIQRSRRSDWDARSRRFRPSSARRRQCPRRQSGPTSAAAMLSIPQRTPMRRARRARSEPRRRLGP